MEHLKTQAVESKVGDDYIPFVKKESKTAPVGNLTTCSLKFEVSPPKGGEVLARGGGGT